jgi:hypothetical protein
LKGHNPKNITSGVELAPKLVEMLLDGRDYFALYSPYSGCGAVR